MKSAQIAQHLGRSILFLAVLISGSRAARAQFTGESSGRLRPAGGDACLTDACQAQSSSTPAQEPAPAASPNQASSLRSTRAGAVIALLPPPVTRARLTPKEKLEIYVRESYGPQNLILPATQAAFFMANPRRDLPRQWKDGGGAFGRWYGVQLAGSTTNRTAQVLTSIAFHEDLRYLPATSGNALFRIFHAMAFTVAERSDSGHKTIALSNLAGAAAGGFVGMTMLPGRYGDVTHAEQRALRGLGTVAVRNLITEFRPEWLPILKKIQVPKILPEWWTPKNRNQP